MQQRGLATLWASTVLLILTSLWGWLCLQSIHADSVRSQQQLQAAQALVNSEALLETALAFIESAYTRPALDADLSLWSTATANHCPSDKAPPQWQCMLWPLDGLPLPEWTDATPSFVRLLRDVRHAPHRIQIMADATLKPSHPGAGSRATVQQSVYVPISATLEGVSSAALVLNEQVLTVDAPHCDMRAWQSVFGQITPLQLKALSALQMHNGLSTETQPTRTVYWIDNPQLWTQHLGTSTSPVVLVFSETACAVECPSLAHNTTVVGTVFYQSQCQASKMQRWQSGIIAGQLGIEADLAPAQKLALVNGPNGLTGSANAHAAIHFDWPKGIDYSRVQRVAGTWKNAGF